MNRMSKNIFDDADAACLLDFTECFLKSETRDADNQLIIRGRTQKQWSQCRSPEIVTPKRKKEKSQLIFLVRFLLRRHTAVIRLLT